MSPPRTSNSSQSLPVRIVDWNRRNIQGLCGLLIQSAVRTMFVVMSDVFGRDQLDMAATEYEDPVETLMADGVRESFGEGAVRQAPWPGPRARSLRANSAGANERRPCTKESATSLRLGRPSDSPG
jgi:hypothetical protein